jgi:predicted N-acetyltransferase YhbS
MNARSDGEVAIRVKKRGDRTRVFAEESGRDVSHVSYGARPVRLGREGIVRMAAIGGVGTDPEFRRRGLARQVLTRVMQGVHSEGYSCVGLHTSMKIVAHRLYRRFGLVDVAKSARAYKLLDPGRFICDALNGMLKGRLRRPPREPDLCLAMSSETFIALWQGEVTFRWAEEANLVEWRGSDASYRRLAEALARRREQGDGG